jgi:hypothetical protein
MFLGIITLLILVIVVISHILLVRMIRDNEAILMIEITGLVKMMAKTIAATSSVLDATQLITDRQKLLDNNMNALATLVDDHSTSVTLQQEQFDTLAKADVLSARREELLRTKELKVALERLMGVALTSRQPPAPNDVLALENLTRRIDELESILGKSVI